MQAASAIARLRERNEWKFVAVLPRADRALAVAWWTVLVLRGLLPAGFAVAMGALVGAVQRGEGAGRAPRARGRRVRAPAGALADPPGDRREPRQPHRRLALRPARPTACVRPPGMGHLEDPKLTSDLTDGARLRPRHHRAAAAHLDGLHRERARRAARRPRLRGRARSPTRGGRRSLLARRLARDALAAARERASGATATPSEVREAQRHAEYAYRLAVDPPAAKELRLFGLADWVDRALPLAPAAPASSCSDEATRLRERPLRLEPAAGARRQRRRVLVARLRRGRRRASTSAGSSPSRRPRWARA